MSKLLTKLSFAALLVASMNASAVTEHEAEIELDDADVAVAPAPATPAASQATSGNLTVKGFVYSNTCYLAADSVNKVVELASVKANELDGAGKTAKAKAFNINLQGCPAVYVNAVKQQKQNVAITFDNDSQAVTTAGNLKNTLADGAKNVDIQLLDESSQPIHLKNKPVVAKALSAGNVSFALKAQYYATGVAEPGDIETQVPFSIEYK